MGKLNIIPTPLAGAFVVETVPFKDERGSFSRFFCSEELSTIMRGKEIRAINFSHTKKIGTIRGLHFQKSPHEELKIIRCIRGKVFDVVVDLRKNSDTYGQWYAETLTPENSKMVCAPPGFAHGFQALEPDVELLYIHTASFNNDADSGIRYNDPLLQISWPLPATCVSDRDLQLGFADQLFKE